MKAKFWIKKIACILFSIVLIAVCVNMFLGPHNIAAGGLTGLAIILEQWIGVSRSLVVYIGNGLVLILAFIFLGKEVFFNTFIGAALLPFFIGIVPRYTIINDTMLSMVIGSAIFGIAVSILYHNKASSGGTGIPPLILQKYFKLSPSIGLFITDGIVVILCLFVFDVDAFFFAIASIFITSATMNYIENGISKKKLVYIISDLHEIITQEILHEIKRGVTLIPSIGAFEQSQRPMLLVTLNSKDYQQLLTIVDRHDKEAFMITDTVSDVHGEGFTYESGSV
ncbi:MAG: YitT family protein [Defluviitaleaceae bacterium]|nr:YitT family protein [Defluviitaleaceae bacterium]MCL2262577.1 YitT family protein [Defluviitaleaceae bacterium]